MSATTTIQTQVGTVEFLLPNFDGIPESLRQVKTALWRAEPKLSSDGEQSVKPNGRPRVNKSPKNAAGFNISKSKPGQWMTHDQARAAFDPVRFTGVGVLLQAGCGLVGIDLDDVKDLLESNPKIKGIIARAKQAGIYCEMSPSSTGLRMFVQGVLPSNAGKRKGGVELYSDVAFLTVTGVHAWPGEVKEAQWLVDELLEVIDGDSHASETSHPLPLVTYGSADESVVKLLCKLAAENQPRLWIGPWDKPLGILDSKEYPSQSEADMALVGYLVRESIKLRCGKDSVSATVMAAFQKSALFRPEKQAQIERYAIPKAMQSVQDSLHHASVFPVDISDIHGDVLTARMFVQIWKEKFLYVASADKWLQWDSDRCIWCWCHKSEALHASKTVAYELVQIGGKVIGQDQSEGKRLVGQGLRAHDLIRLKAMLKVAASEPGMTVLATELDSDPWLLGVQNGVVDLRTGRLMANEPRMLITRICAATYDQEAKCPRWDQFLNEVFGGDVETIETVQRALGYTLTGNVTEEVLFICHGYGSNGKSVFNNVVSAIMGDYARVAPSSLLTTRRNGDTSPRNDIASIVGSRYVAINELQSGDRLDEQVVKLLAGREAISARFLHKEHFEFMPTFKPWLRTNHKPIITGDDDGIWRRLVLIAFARQFTGAQRDPHLEEKLLAEREGILAWMIAGAQMWRRDGLRLSPAIRLDCASYRKDSDLLGDFIGEVCTLDSNDKCLQADLFDRHQHWCQRSGIRAMSKISFTRRLAERGYTEARSNGKRYYTGLRVTDPQRM